MKFIHLYHGDSFYFILYIILLSCNSYCSLTLLPNRVINIIDLAAYLSQARLFDIRNDDSCVRNLGTQINLRNDEQGTYGRVFCY